MKTSPRIRVTQTQWDAYTHTDGGGVETGTGRTSTNLIGNIEALQDLETSGEVL